jgi:hemerythrin
MALIVWTKALDTNIEIIDLQHRKLVDMINEIADSVESQNQEDIERIMDLSVSRLFDYANYHFQTEETLLAKSGYDHSTQHQASHNAFRIKLGEVYKRFCVGEDISKELLTILKSWLENHILIEDMKYVASVKEFEAQA